MKIKVVPENMDKINAAIADVQKRARMRTINAKDVFTACKDVSDRLDITKKAMHNVCFTADMNAQTFPGCYRGIPESTIIFCKYLNGFWYLMDVRRDYCRRPTKAYTVQLTEAAKTAIIERCESFR